MLLQTNPQKTVNVASNCPSLLKSTSNYSLNEPVETVDNELNLEEGLVDFRSVVNNLLEPWSKGFSKKTFNSTLFTLKANRFNIGQYKIYNGRLYTKGNFNIFISYFVKDLLNKYCLPNLEFLYLNAPSSRQFKCPKKRKFSPIFVQLVDHKTKQNCYVPFKNRFVGNLSQFPGDHGLLENPIRDWPKIQDIVNSNQIPWSDRFNKLVWRGNTGSNPIERGKLCDLSKAKPHLINAKHAHSPSPSRKVTTNSLSLPKHLKYKYQILMHGFCGSFPGTEWRLLSGSLTFWQDYHRGEFWYSKCLKPWKHYVPVKADLSDLVGKIKWAIKNDKKAALIANNARNFALKNLTSERIQEFGFLMLKKYSELQKFEVDPPTEDYFEIPDNLSEYPYSITINKSAFARS